MSVENLIDVFNKEIEFDPIDIDNSNQIEVISFTKISAKRQTTLTKEVADILGLNSGDEIVFILDKDGLINVRKLVKDKLNLNPNEKFLSNTIVGKDVHRKKLTISREIIQILYNEDSILWILDEFGNIIIKDTILNTKNKKNKSNLIKIIRLSDIFQLGNSRGVVIPTEVRDILMVDTDDIIGIVREDDKVFVKNIKDVEETSNLISMVKLDISRKIPIKKEILELLKIEDKLLWILDEFGNMMIKNNFILIYGNLVGDTN